MPRFDLSSLPKPPPLAQLRQHLSDLMGALELALDYAAQVPGYAPPGFCAEDYADARALMRVLDREMAAAAAGEDEPDV